MLIPDRLWAQMTEDEQALVLETIRGQRLKGKEATCPHCGESIRIASTYQLSKKDLTDLPGTRAATANAPEAPRVGAKDAELLDAAKATGLFDVFVHAVKEERQYAGVPGDLETFFLQFWALLAPVTVPKLALASWIDEFGGRIQIFGSNGILLVTSDGVAKAFIPNRFVRASLTTGKADPQIVPRSVHFERWVKGKFGYVPVGAQRFTEALRQHHIGAFGRLVQ